MKKNYKKMLALLLVLVMAVSAAGCKKEAKAPADEATKAPEATAAAEGDAEEVVPGWQTNAADKVELSWYINYSWFTQVWGESAVSKKITEDTGITVNFVVPAGNEAEKLNSLIASDSLPDLVTLGWYEPQVPQLIEDGIVYALDELATEYDPYWFEVANPGRVGWYTQADGHIYGYPNSAYSPEDYAKYDNIPSNQTFLVRKDMYEALGSPDMTTPEGFIAAVKAAKEKFPEVEGQPLIPYGAHEFAATGNNSFDNYLANFLAIPYEKDGKAYDRLVDPELVRWLKAFRELGQEGLLLDDIFIDKRAQMEEKMATGRYFAMLYQRTDMAGQQKMLYEKDPNSIYIAVDGPKNSNADAYTLPGTGINGWTLTFISKKCQRPDRAIQFCSYLMSEYGQHLNWLGIEGEHWDYVDGVPTMNEATRAILDGDRATYDKTIGSDSTYWMFQDNAMARSWAVKPKAPLGQMEEWTYPYVMNTSAYEVSIPGGTEEIDIDTNIKNEWGVVLPQLLLAKTEADFDKIWNAFLEKRSGFGNDQLMELRTKNMLDAKAKLGL